MKVVLAGGGTAGHVFPALAVADELTARGIDVTFVGAADGQEAQLVPSAGYPFVPVRAISAQTRVSLRSVRAVWLALRAARRIRPSIGAADVVIGIGGFASAPAVLAARTSRKPLVLIEQNSVPGAVNRLGARWAVAVATTFEATAGRLPRGPRVVRTGNPVRREIVEVTARRAALSVQAHAAFDLEPGRATILVVGGSQGALRLDEVLADTLPLLAGRADLQILVSTGRGHEAVVTRAVDAGAPLLVRVVPFIERMDLALAVARLAVSRSGASVAELAVCGVPAILVPYPYATEDHQQANAREVVDAGGATMILESTLSPSRLASAILELVDDEGRRVAMATAAVAWARPDAAQRIADLVEEVAV